MNRRTPALILMMMLLFLLPAAAQEAATATDEQTAAQEAAPEAAAATQSAAAQPEQLPQAPSASSAVLLDPVTGFPVIENTPFVIFNEGISWANVTRLQKQQKRSNFVWTENMAGAFFGFQTVNMQPSDSMVRLAVYYPYFAMFNGMQQYPKQTLLYAVDLFAAPFIQSDMWWYVRLKFGLGGHFMYQLKDEYHMHYFGIGGYIGAELPLASHWTILVDGMFDWDYPNFGPNRRMSPFDYSWQYQLQVGVRYSVQNPNIFSYIDSRVKS